MRSCASRAPGTATLREQPAVEHELPRPPTKVGDRERSESGRARGAGAVHAVGHLTLYADNSRHGQ